VAPAAACHARLSGPGGAEDEPALRPLWLAFLRPGPAVDLKRRDAIDQEEAATVDGNGGRIDRRRRRVAPLQLRGPFVQGKQQRVLRVSLRPPRQPDVRPAVGPHDEVVRHGQVFPDGCVVRRRLLAAGSCLGWSCPFGDRVGQQRSAGPLVEAQAGIALKRIDGLGIYGRTPQTAEPQHFQREPDAPILGGARSSCIGVLMRPNPGSRQACRGLCASLLWRASTRDLPAPRLGVASADRPLEVVAIHQRQHLREAARRGRHTCTQVREWERRSGADAVTRSNRHPTPNLATRESRNAVLDKSGGRHTMGRYVLAPPRTTVLLRPYTLF